jgi:hypothetical protein
MTTLLFTQILDTDITELQTFAMTQETDVAALIEQARMVLLVYGVRIGF